MRFVCDVDGTVFTFKPTPLSKAVARYSMRLHVARLLVELGLPLETPFEQAKAVYMSREEIRELRRAGTSVKDLARMYDLPERKVDRWTDDIVITPIKPTRGAVPRGIVEPPEPEWMGG
jgi:hypothetical protein